MDTLPYEILQLVASSLMPKYQCRLALTSRFCHLYLYNDLLRWHARKATIQLPVYEIIPIKRHTDVIIKSLIKGKNVVEYWYHIPNYRTTRSQDNTVGVLYVANYSNKKFVRLYYYGTERREWRDRCYLTMSVIYNYGRQIYNYLTKPTYRKYLHKDILLMLVNIRTMSFIECKRARIRVRYYIDSKTSKFIVGEMAALIFAWDDYC